MTKKKPTKILLLNGPNLNLLGKREVGIYGKETFEDLLERLQATFADATLEYYQSNLEGELINKLHEVGFDKTYTGIVFNPGGYTHTSVALADAVAAIKVPVVEVHISNTFAREEFRHHSYISPRAKGIIVGFGLDGYKLAIMQLGNFTILNKPKSKGIGF